MAKKYYAWKNADCNGNNPEWVEMTGNEFYEFKRKPENRKRLFIELGKDEGLDDVLVLESTKTEYDKWNNQHNKSVHQRKAKTERGFIEVSLYSETKNDLTFEDMIPSDENVEEQVCLLIRLEELKKAMSKLTLDERKFVELMYGGSEILTERQMSDLLNISKSHINRTKNNIFKKIKKSMGQN